MGKNLSRRDILKTLGSLPASSSLDGQAKRIADALPDGLIPLRELGEELYSLYHKNCSAYLSGGLIENPDGSGWFPKNHYDSPTESLLGMATNLARIATQPREHILKALEFWKNHEIKFQLSGIPEDKEYLAELQEDLRSATGTDRTTIEASIKEMQECIEGCLQAAARTASHTPEQIIAEWKETMQPFGINSGELLENPARLPHALKKINALLTKIKDRTLPTEEIQRLRRDVFGGREQFLPAEDSLKRMFEYVGDIRVIPFVNEFTQDVHILRLSTDGRDGIDKLTLLQQLFEDVIQKKGNGWDKMQLTRQGDMLILRPQPTARADQVTEPLAVLQQLGEPSANTVSKSTQSAART